jgi:hypothetical protein
MKAIPMQNADQRPKESTTLSVQSSRVGRTSVSLKISWILVLFFVIFADDCESAFPFTLVRCARMTSGRTSGRRKYMTGKSAL